MADEKITTEEIEEKATEVKEEAAEVKEEAAAVEEVKEETAEEKPEEPKEEKKKKGILAKILIILAVILGVIIIGLGVLFFLVTSGENPAKPRAMASQSDIVSNVAENVIDSIFDEEEGISVNVRNEDVAFIYNTKVEPMLKETLASYGVELNNSFLNFENDQAAYYANVKYGFIDIPVAARVELSADDSNNILLTLKEASFGKLSLPESVISTVLSNVSFPEGIGYDKESGSISYSLNSLNDTVKAYIKETFLKSTDDDNVFEAAIKTLLEPLVDKINIKLSDVKVSDSQLKISVSDFMD